MRNQKDEDHFLHCKLRYSLCKKCQRIAKEEEKEDITKQETESFDKDSRIQRTRHSKQLY